MEENMAKQKITPIDDKVRVIPANKYDTIEFGALAFGGIGAGLWFHEEWVSDAGDWGAFVDDVNCPICANGIAVTAGLAPMEVKGQTNKPVRASGIHWEVNDKIVKHLIALGRSTRDEHGHPRVSFKDYCKAGNIVRGA